LGGESAVQNIRRGIGRTVLRRRGSRPRMTHPPAKREMLFDPGANGSSGDLPGHIPISPIRATIVM
jgi:hypothetical protein